VRKPLPGPGPEGKERGRKVGKWRALGSAAAISRRWQPGLAAIIDEKLGERRSLANGNAAPCFSENANVLK
jgi:hypothetical protein